MTALAAGESRQSTRYTATMFQYDGKPEKKWSVVATLASARLTQQPLAVRKH